jgi:hypothetical protein
MHCELSFKKIWYWDFLTDFDVRLDGLQQALFERRGLITPPLEKIRAILKTPSFSSVKIAHYRKFD